MKKNNIWFLTIFSFLILITCSFKDKNGKILVLAEKSGKNKITLVFKNTSKKKFILPANILLTGDILRFNNAPKINFIGIMVDRSYPHHFDKQPTNLDDFLEKECYLNDTLNYRVILPNHSLFLKYNVYDNYEGIEAGRKYIVHYKFNIDKEYSDYCPLIWNGSLESNKIKF